jgi:hypothetical protein
MPDPQQYTDAQLSDGRTLRFLGQLGPDEVRQKVQGFRQNETARNPSSAVPKPPLPGALNPSFQYDPERKGSGEIGGGPTMRQSLVDSVRGPALGVATVAPMATGGLSVPLQMGVSGLAGAAQDKLLGGDNDEALTSGVIGAALPAIGPALNSRVGQTLWGAVKGTAGRVPVIGPMGRGAIRGGLKAWRASAPALEAGTSEAIESSAPRTLIQQMGGKPVEAITDRPSGRLVLSPEEAASETRQLSLAKKIASQRGMQYAAGMKPMPPSPPQ